MGEYLKCLHKGSITVVWEKFMVENIHEKNHGKNFVLAGYRQKYFNAEDFYAVLLNYLYP